jgi:DNA-binding transcriptional LysR family regulator
LATRGIPQQPKAIQSHDIVLFSGLNTRPEWAFRTAEGDAVVPCPTRLTVNTADVAIAAALAGRGLTRVLSYMIAPELNAGRLQIVLADFETAPLPINVVYQEGRKAAARVRAFVDFMVDQLRADSSIY